ncbi:class I SAM-dependent methyltransferase [Tsuneonella sp. YG55]|uniref:Class I SAM-dependent methyltransferase n=1 Tax=Tsuneonella litorea TaxID=2976475 RepID=A0A9X2W195_9SPHN|nr:class I SAM-dependent methyltransferase [Tsuneonella litorea]MCT2559058.1 class I SAM-dependent methyltransferase [Tsuneonella litorea]
MTDRRDWEGRTGRKWAEEWRRTDRSFAEITHRLLDGARRGPVTRVLDVGCGAGELSLALAREHGDAQVVGIDVSEQLVAVARERGARLRNASFECADAAEWSVPQQAPDLIVSRHGVMFFPDPMAAFAHLRAQMVTGGRLLFSCFRDRRENPWASRIADLIPPGRIAAPDPGAPGPFAFADRAYVEAILAGANWRDVAFDRIDYAYVAGAGGDPVSDALTYFLAIGPAAAAAAELDPDERAVFVGRLEAFLAGYRDGSIVALPAAAWIVSARTD